MRRLSTTAMLCVLAGCGNLLGLDETSTPSPSQASDDGGPNSEAADGTTSDTTNDGEGGNGESDATTDVTDADAGTRLKDMTFELGLTGSTGAEVNSGMLEDITLPLKGTRSAKSSTDGFESLTQGFGGVGRDEIYITLYARLDKLPPGDVNFVKIFAGTGSPILAVNPTGDLSMTLGGQKTSLARNVPLGGKFRIGIHVIAAGTFSTVEVKTAGFTELFGDVTTLMGSLATKLTSVQLGFSYGEIHMTYDDVRIDTADWPEL